QILIGTAAVQDNGALEDFGEACTAGEVMLNDADVVAASQFLRQPVADAAAAGDSTALVRHTQTAQLAHHRTDIRLGGNEENFIICLDHRRTGGHNGAISPINGRYP